MPTYSSMWNPVTSSQGTVGSAVSRSRNASCELPDANITDADPRVSTAARTIADASAAAASARAAGSGSTRISAPLTTGPGSRELREPLARGVEQLVGHAPERVEVDAARERVGQHRGEDVVAAARDRGLHGQLLGHHDAPQLFGQHGRRRHAVAP